MRKMAAGSDAEDKSKPKVLERDSHDAGNGQDTAGATHYSLQHLHLQQLGDALELGLFAAVTAHVLIAPYTKVEESFSLQAVHDVLTFGASSQAISKYDHVVFSGAVPRSFIGPVLLSMLSYPVMLTGKLVGIVNNSAEAGLVLRLVLAWMYAASICTFGRRAVRGKARAKRSLTKAKATATTASTSSFVMWLLYLATSIVQFQPLFWAGRTTPNGVVMPVVVYALARIFTLGSKEECQRSAQVGLALLTASTVIARLELVGILAPVAIWLAWSGRAGYLGFPLNKIHSFAKVLAIGAMSGLAALMATMTVDSYFWQRSFIGKGGPFWPELHAVLFNIVDGKSAEWGTSPWHAYITSHVPKLTAGAVLLVALGVVLQAQQSRGEQSKASSEHSAWPMLLVIAAHTATMSLVAHKEARFIAYLVPLLNIFAARGALALWQGSFCTRHKGSRLLTLATRLVLAAIASATIAQTLLSTIASEHNYPGGHALAMLHQIRAHHDRTATVHIDVLPAMTGVSLFQSVHLDTRRNTAGAFGISWLPCVTCERTSETLPPYWTYDKTEDLFASSLDVQVERHRARLRALLVPTFTFILSDTPNCHGLEEFARIKNENGVLLSGFLQFKGIRRRRKWPDIDLLKQSALRAVTSMSSLRTALSLASPIELVWEPSVWLCERIAG